MYETWSQAREERGLPQEGRWRRRWSKEPPERSLGQVPGLGGVPIILIACICIQGRVFSTTNEVQMFQYSVIKTCDPQTNILLLTMVTMFQWSIYNVRMLVDAAVWQQEWIILTHTFKCCNDTRLHMTATQEYLYIDVCHLPTNGAMMLPTLAHIEAEPSPTLRTLMNMSSPLYIAKSIKWKHY